MRVDMKTLRITSGTAKNKKLVVPDVPGIRPVQEVVKLAMFSIMGDLVEEARVLDLYAGSGNLGLEALSRGAKWCDFVDEQWNAKQAIITNIRNCGFEEKSEVFHSDAVKFVGNTSNKYDIVFVDPFYEDTSHKFLVKLLGEVLKNDGVIFFLHGEQLNIDNIIKDSELRLADERKYGMSFMSVLRKK
jgi:16S rRNA (guanine966-N2)-methyltransferase